jgi:uncharacterized membrane protein
MSLKKQLSRWQAAGLIDQQTLEGIVDFEAKRGRPRLDYVLAALGAVSIGIGIISLVAANWDGIGPRTKLAADVVLATALAVAVYYATRRAAWLLVEGLGIVYYLFSLASLALVGQVYQLGTPAWQALALWSVVTVPLVLLLRSYLAGMVWFIGASLSYVMATLELFEFTHRSRSADWAVGLLLAWPLVAMLVARAPWLNDGRRRFIGAVSVGAWSAVVLLGLLSPFAFYVHISEKETLDIGLVLGGGAFIALYHFQKRWLGSVPGRVRLAVALLLGGSWLVFSLGMVWSHRDLDLVGAVLQVGYLCLLAFVCLQFGWGRAFHATTGVIALRILIVYFEVFGSMLSTGLGLVSGGALTLLLAWLWKRKSPELAARLNEQRGGERAT